MPPAGREAFLAELRALPAERRAAFLAALYEARGRRVERDGTRLGVGGPDGRTVLVPDGPAADRDASRGTDAVLVLGDDGKDEGPAPGNAERIDGTEVYRAALYAIDRADCERLVERFFGRSLSSFPGADGRPDRDGEEGTDDAEPGGAGAARDVDSSGEDGRDGSGGTASGTTGVEAAASGRTAGTRPPNGRTTDGRTTDGRTTDGRTADGRTVDGWTVDGWTTNDGETRGGAAAPDGPGGRDAAGTDGTGERRSWRRPGVAVVLVAILALALAGGGTIPGTLLAPAPGDGTAATETLTPLTPKTPAEPDRTGGTPAAFGDIERTPGRGDTALDIDRGASGSEAGETSEAAVTTVETPARSASERLPPGVSASGAIDEATLAEAHLRALANRSFRLTLVYREFAGGRPVGMRQEVVRVERPGRYRVDTHESGKFRTTPVGLEGGDAYANGSDVTLRTGGDRPGPLPRGDEVEPGSDGAVPYGDALGQYLRWFLSVEESTLVGEATVDGQPAYWLTIDGDPWVESENTTGSALVARDGTVRELRRTYDVPDHPGTSVVVTIRVTDVGSTSIRPPGWYDGDGAEAGEANGTATGTPTATPAESGDAGEDHRTGE